nr:hypothetical protein BaRGS_027033 [Batillaria attramentaria]
MEAFGSRTALRIIVIGPRDGNLNFLDLLALGSEDVTLPPPAADPAKAIASLLFSSGTTGVPKGVQITQRNIMACIHLFLADEPDRMQDMDTLCTFLPFFHAYGQVIILLIGLTYGVRNVVMSKFEMVPFLNFCQRYKATVLHLVPPVVLGMANFPRLADYNLSSLRMVICGAAPLGKEVEAQFTQKLNLPCVLQGYGMTENMVASICTFKHNKPASAGQLLPNTEVKVAPAVLEDLLMAHPELSDVCVIGVPDPVAGELPRAYVVRIPGSKITEQEVKDFVAKQVPSYMQLRGGVEFRETIPKSPSGKILRRLLRDELKQQQKSRL